ncbi:MAG: ABC transporter, partial [Peptostreptococcaceae bacterium]
KNPEYLVVLDRGVATGGESTAKSVLDNDIVKSMDAYKNGNIIYLDAYTWYINDAGLNSINIMIDDIVEPLSK